MASSSTVKLAGMHSGRGQPLSEGHVLVVDPPMTVTPMAVEDQKAVGPMVALAPVVDLAPVGPRQGEDQGLIVVVVTATVVTASMVTSGRGQVVVGVHLMMLLVHLMVTPHGVAMSPVSVRGAVGLASVVTSVAMALNGRQVVLVSGHGSGRSGHLVEARDCH